MSGSTAAAAAQGEARRGGVHEHATAASASSCSRATSTASSRHEVARRSAPRRVRLLPPPLPLRGVAPHVRADDGGRADAAGLMAKLAQLRTTDPEHLHRLGEDDPLRATALSRSRSVNGPVAAGSRRVAVERDREDGTRRAAEHARDDGDPGRRPRRA
jgi:hypothetical protein